MSQILFVVILCILAFDFVLERTLSFLNIRESSKKLPDILQGIYDAEKYDKQQKYFRANSRFGLLTATFSFLITLLMFSFDGFAWVNSIVDSYVQSPVFTPVIFFAVLMLANDILTIPFEVYDTFVIEERFGFNKVTPWLFVVDKLKSYGMTLILGGGLLSAIVWIYVQMPNYFWLLAWAIVTGFSLFMTMFYSNLIVPLFNKQTPLPEGELRTDIEKFATSVHFKLENIFVIDGSKRSTKANAYFSGLGAKKRIVLYDTLMDKMTTDEIVAVLAHEIGHYKHRHTLKNFALSLPTSLVLFVLLGWALQSDDLGRALGSDKATFQLNAIAFSILYSPVSMLLGVFGNVLSRRYEYQADAFANQYGYGQQLISGLKKLTSSSLGNLMPHPLYVFFHYSHPTLLQRMRNINSEK